MEISELSTPADIGAAVRLMRDIGADSHPVLRELGLYAFWGATTLALWDDNRPVSVISMKIGKRKKNIWEPYANWYGAYTLPVERRRGLATQLYREMENRAELAGCRRLKSLAGSAAGLGLHASLHHQGWGVTEMNEVIIDTPLPLYSEFYADKGAPPPAKLPKPLTPGAMKLLMKKGLRYDHRP